MNDLINANDQTMTLKEITDLLDVRHDNAMKTVSKMAENIEFGTLLKTRIVYNDKGQTIDTYILDKRQSMAVSAKLNTAMLMKVIDRWQELEEKGLPLSLEEMTLQVIQGQQVKIEAQQKAIEAKDELIVASNEASIKAGEILVSAFCKSVDIIDIGSTKFYEWMREQGFVFKNSREPIQKYRDRGFFTWKPSQEEYGGKVRYALRITPRGKVWLASKYLRYLDNGEAV